MKNKVPQFKYISFDKELEIEEVVSETFMAAAVKVYGKTLHQLQEGNEVVTPRKIFKAIKIK